MFVVMERKNSTKKGRLWSLCRVQHLTKASFTECNGHCTRQASVSQLCRVLGPWHSAKNFQKKIKALLSAPFLALGKEFPTPFSALGKEFPKKN
jgi:hypothetical protein